MGGKKKSKVEKRAPPKKVPTKFDCEFCGNDKSINIQFQRVNGRRIANVKCTVCKRNGKVDKVLQIDKPIDIFIRWKSQIQNKQLKDEDLDNLSVDSQLEDA